MAAAGATAVVLVVIPIVVCVSAERCAPAESRRVAVAALPGSADGEEGDCMYALAGKSGRGGRSFSTRKIASRDRCTAVVLVDGDGDADGGNIIVLPSPISEEEATAGSGNNNNSINKKTTAAAIPSGASFSSSSGSAPNSRQEARARGSRVSRGENSRQPPAVTSVALLCGGVRPQVPARLFGPSMGDLRIAPLGRLAPAFPFFIPLLLLIVSACVAASGRCALRAAAARCWHLLCAVRRRRRRLASLFGH